MGKASAASAAGRLGRLAHQRPAGGAQGNGKAELTAEMAYALRRGWTRETLLEASIEQEMRRHDGQEITLEFRLVGQIQAERLSALQKEREAYPQAMAGYLGWYDESHLYLLPEAAYARVARHFRDQGRTASAEWLESKLKRVLVLKRAALIGNEG